MFIRSMVVLGVLAGFAQAANAQVSNAWCTAVSDSATKSKLLEWVRPEIEFRSNAGVTLARFLQPAGPYADYSKATKGYHHTLDKELELYDVSFRACGGRYLVDFVPKELPKRVPNTFIFNKQTGWLIETVSDESRFKVWKNEEMFDDWE